jgi:predicted LPLAT superfamily acyltransferase
MSSQWRGQPERGSRSALRLIIWLALHGGRRLCRALLVPITAYFFITAPQARRASQNFMRRSLARAPTWLDTWRHLYVFATTLLDRVYLLNGRHHLLAVAVQQEAVFWTALAAGRGCLLLGSHLGSFDMLGVIGSVEKQLKVNVVMHVDDSAQLQTLLSCAGRRAPYNVIPLGHPGSMLKVRECLERGEVVGILADRVYGDEATQSLPFLGSPARFSQSPLRLAQITGAPTVMVFGLFRGGNRYQIVFEALAGQPGYQLAAAVAAGVDSGMGGIADYQRRYVECLERHARDAPCNWFNFYDYWGA